MRESFGQMLVVFNLDEQDLCIFRKDLVGSAYGYWITAAGLSFLMTPPTPHRMETSMIKQGRHYSKAMFSLTSCDVILGKMLKCFCLFWNLIKKKLLS